MILKIALLLGTGEQIMRTMITTKCAQRITQEDNIQSAVTTCLQEDFLGMCDSSILWLKC